MSTILTFGLGRRSTVARPGVEVIHSVEVVMDSDPDLGGVVIDLDIVHGEVVLLEGEDDIVEIITPVGSEVEDIDELKGEVP